MKSFWVSNSLSIKWRQKCLAGKIITDFWDKSVNSGWPWQWVQEEQEPLPENQVNVQLLFCPQGWQYSVIGPCPAPKPSHKGKDSPGLCGTLTTSNAHTVESSSGVNNWLWGFVNGELELPMNVYWHTICNCRADLSHKALCTGPDIQRQPSWPQ